MRSSTSHDRLSMRYHVCTICSREFKRSDTLQRHQRVHNKDTQSRKTRRTSCTACVKSKKRCSRHRPSCETCIKFNLICIYEDVEKALKSTTNRESALHSAQNGRNLQHNAGNQTLELSARQNFLPLVMEPSCSRSPLPSLLVVEGPSGLAPEDFDGTARTSHVDDLLLDADLGLDLWNEDLTWDWILGSQENRDFSTTNGIWLNPESPINRNGCEPASIMPISMERTVAEDPPAIDDSRAHAMPSVLPTPTPRDRCEPGDSWPMEWHAEAQQPMYLPKLGNTADRIEPTYYGMKPLDESFRKRLKDTILLPLEYPPWQAVSLANFPNKDQLDRCIDLFFAHHNSVFGILHRPTFQANQEPVVLILAVASIGACYSNIEGSKGFANALSELNRRLLWYMAEHDPRFLRSTYYITAQLLQYRYGYCSGSKRLFELSESSRNMLVHNATYIGIFQESASSDQEDDSDDGRWRKWIGTEAVCRLAWAIYIHDTSATYLGNKRPCISLASMRHMFLPSSKELWEAESAQAWSALHPWSKTAPLRTSFFSTLSNLFVNRNTAAYKIKDPQHQYIIILTYTRMLWSLKEITAVSLVFMDNNRGEGFESGKRDLITALDQLLVACGLFNPHLTETPNILLTTMRNAQIIHICHLQAAGHFMDWLHPLTRGGSGSKRAHEQMLLWADKNPIQVREVAYHSAQIMAITRRYSQNLSLEVLNLFHAGIALWCAAGLLMRKRLGVPHPSQNIRLDVLASGESLESDRTDVSRIRPLSQTIHKWIQGDESYESAVLSIHGVPDIACNDGRKLILLQVAEVLGRNKVWGIAQSFLAVVRQFISAEDS